MHLCMRMALCDISKKPRLISQSMKALLNFIINLLVAISSVLFLSSIAHSEDYQFLDQWGDIRPDLSVQLNVPRGVAVDKYGYVYVSETYSKRILKYDSNGAIIWTRSDCNGSPINYPMEMAVDSSNNLYVVEMLNNRVSIYNSSGVCIRTITENFNSPIGVAVDDALNLYVTDRHNNVVKKFDSSGSLIATWTGFGGPWGITFHNGYIYVTESAKVKKLTSNGGLIKEWGSSGIGTGQFMMAEGIAAYNNLLYVADGEYGRIHVFDLDGNFVKTIAERGTGNGQLQFSTALAIDNNNGWLYVSDDDNNRIVKLDLNGNYIDQWGCDSSGTTGIRYPTKIAIDKNNDRIYVVDSGNHRIISLTTNLQVLNSWGSYGDGNGQFRYPIDAAVDSNGNVYVVDNVKRNIQKFDSNGTFSGKLDINFGDTLKYLYGLHGIAIDASNNIYVVDADTKKLYKLDSAGNKVAGWSVGFYPTGVDIDEKKGFIYVSHFGVGSPNADTVQQLDMSGNLIRYIGKNFSGSDSLFHPWDVVVDENSDIYVTDTSHHRIVKFDSNGNYITKWGATGGMMDDSIEPGKFAYPYGIAVDKRGYVYVADTNNHRIQKFARVVFNDVPATYWALPFINKIYDNSITSGCSSTPLNYCPGSPVNRAQMTVFIIKAMGATPSSASYNAYFDDIAEDGFAGYINRMKELAITSGCSTRQYCPATTVTRDQMAVFLTRAFLE